MRLSTRLKINAILFAVMMVVISALFATVFKMQREVFEKSLISDDLMRGSYELNSLSNRYLRSPGERAKEQWNLVHDALVRNLDNEVLRHHPKGETIEHQKPHVILTRMNRNLGHMKVLFGNLIEDEKKAAGASMSANNAAFERHRTQIADLIIRRSRDLSLDAARLEAISNEQVSAINRKIIILNPVVAVALTAITLWMSLRIGRSITVPVDKLRTEVEKVGAGNLDLRVGMTTNDEIGQLSAAFDRMTERLKVTTVSRDELSSEVAERKRAEEALKESERYLNAIIENAPACIKLVARDGTLLKMNSAGAAIIGAASVEQVQGKSIYSCITSQYRRAFMDLTGEVFQNRPGTLEFEAIGLNGRRIWLNTRAVPLYDNEGTITALLGITVDITERKQAEEERERLLEDLGRSNKELEQFAYVASHDLQEPLRMVASYVQLLEKKYKGQLDEKADQYIYYAVDGVDRMQKLIEGLLAFSRISRREGVFNPVDMNAVFEGAVSNLTAAVRESRALVTKDDLPTVSGDAIQLTQLFQNLIGNAIKFTASGTSPRVHVSAKQEGESYVFSVRDNGIGVDPKYSDRIFLIFHRLHNRDKYPGTGIGLALCKRIVERHHGRIWVESVPDDGSTFFFTIPQ